MSESTLPADPTPNPGPCVRGSFWMAAFLAPLASGLFLTPGCSVHRDLPPAQINALEKLRDVMDVQERISDPQFKKIDRTHYQDADWVAFADMGDRLVVTSTKVRQFSKGPGFDALADQLHSHAQDLSAAAASKNAAAASAALAVIQATCQECHSKFK
jgi:Cytochrome C'